MGGINILKGTPSSVPADRAVNYRLTHPSALFANPGKYFHA
jgi:hypothetical protein